MDAEGFKSLCNNNTVSCDSCETITQKPAKIAFGREESGADTATASVVSDEFRKVIQPFVSIQNCAKKKVNDTSDERKKMKTIAKRLHLSVVDSIECEIESNACRWRVLIVAATSSSKVDARQRSSCLNVHNV